MLRQVVTRTLRVALQIGAVSCLTFLLAAAAPGRFQDELRLDPGISPATVQALTRDLGLDHPWPVRFAAWARDAVRGRFGYSLTYRVPVRDLIAPRLFRTIVLTLVALVCAWVIALVIGIATTLAVRGRWRHAVDAAVAAALALPDLLLVMLVLLAAAAVAPAARTLPPAVLPAAALTGSVLPALVHHVRRALDDALPGPLDVALEARGLPPAARLLRHALPLASAPLVALAGLSIGSLTSASILVEVVTGWPGLGPLLLEAVLARDDYVVVAAAVTSCAFVLIGHTAADLVQLLLDPRARGRA